MNLLIVEDDPRVANYLETSLGKEGYSVLMCSGIDELETTLLNQNYEFSLVILDRMIGKVDGANYIKKIIQRWPTAAILVLSSLDIPSEKARTLDLGADDYLAKPFSLEELSARLRLLQRRGKPSGDSLVKSFGDLLLSLSSQEVRCNSLRVDLSRKEFQLLLLLIENPGRVYNKIQILDRVWDINSLVESNVVEATIKNLRKKISEAGSKTKIESKRNFGYWIEA